MTTTPETVTLPAGHTLAVTADAASSGNVYPFAERVGDTPGVSTVAASATVTLGPFATIKRYQIVPTSGSLTHVIAAVDFPTLAEGDTSAAVLIATAKAEAIADAAVDATTKADAAAVLGASNAAAAALLAHVPVVGTVGDVRDFIGAGVPAATVQAALLVNPAGANNAMDYTAVAYGTGGNSISIEYVDPAAVSAALSVGVVGSAITVNLATDTGVKSSLSVNPAGDDNALTYTAVTAGPGGDAISIEYVDPAANDASLSVGVVGDAITVNLATGGGGAITSTAADVLAAIEASGPAAALVTVAIDAADTGAGDDGSGVVTAMALANLASGANGAITSTAAQVKTAIEASGPAAALVTLANNGGDTGAGVVTAMALDSLTGGTGLASAIGVAGIGSRYTDITNGKLYINGGTKAVPVWNIVTSA